jgi:hypothetical protein
MRLYWKLVDRTGEEVRDMSRWTVSTVDANINRLDLERLYGPDALSGAVKINARYVWDGPYKREDGEPS